VGSAKRIPEAACSASSWRPRRAAQAATVANPKITFSEIGVFTSGNGFCIAAGNKIRKSNRPPDVGQARIVRTEEQRTGAPADCSFGLSAPGLYKATEHPGRRKIGIELETLVDQDISGVEVARHKGQRHARGAQGDGVIWAEFNRFSRQLPDFGGFECVAPRPSSQKVRSSPRCSGLAIRPATAESPSTWSMKYSSNAMASPGAP
jgi:hypothetical protein